MAKKSIMVILGIGLILVGIIISAPVIAGLLGSFFKGYGITLTGIDAGKILLGVASLIAGFVMLFIGVSKRLFFWLSLLGVFIIIMGAGSFFSYKQVMQISQDKSMDVEFVVDRENGIEVEIPFNSNTTQIANILEEKGIIKYPTIFKLLSKINGYDNSYQAGTHILSSDLNYDRIMRVLSGKPESIKVTIQEGLTYGQIADKLVKSGLISKSKFNDVTNTEKFDYPFMNGLPKRAIRLEGYLFPDTYEFALKAGELNITKTLLDNFNRKFKEDYYKRAKELKMSVDQIITLASIIERESKDPDERRIISGIFHKRLAGKDPSIRKLQSCATIQYIFLNKEGTVKQKILIKDTEIEDPYNTYKYEGLPPGPICSPGLDSIDAALYPEKTDYMYFIGDGSGSTAFSRTYKEHLNAMKKYGLTN